MIRKTGGGDGLCVSHTEFLAMQTRDCQMIGRIETRQSFGLATYRRLAYPHHRPWA